MVSPSSGAVFEKRIIEKYIIENGVDPINGKELRVEDLIEIKSEYYFSLSLLMVNVSSYYICIQLLS